MAELLLKVHDQRGGKGAAGYLDGDVVVAWSQNQIGWRWASAICAPKHAGWTSEGLRADGLARGYLNRMRQFRFTRISATEVRRRNLFLGQNQTFTFAASELDAMIAQRLQHPYHAIFGTLARPVWYGGRTRVGVPYVRDVWTWIEANSAYRRADYREAPTGQVEPYAFLMLSVDDMSEEEMTDLTEPELADPDDPGSDIVKKRRSFVRWRDMSQADRGATVEDIDDRRKRVDVRRHKEHSRAVIVEAR